MAMQPSGKDDFGGEAGGLAGEIDEDGLGDVLGEMGIVINDAKRGGINKIDVPRHQLGKRRFRALGVVSVQELLVIGHHLSIYQKPPKRKSDKK